jgi:hypothetical protein
VSGTIHCSGANATFTPGAPLAHFTVYTAAIATGVKDLAGNAMASAVSFTFTTAPAPDHASPAVIATSPPWMATHVGSDTSVSATFDEPMDPGTISTATFFLKDAAGHPVAGTVSYGGTTATFTPNADLDYSTAYAATITTGARDVAGNSLFNDLTWTFTTVEPSTLRIISSGTGSGTVNSTPSGITCGTGGACSKTFGSGTVVTLAATPGPGSVFEGFSGACSSIKPTCTVTLAGDASVTAILDTYFVSEAGHQLGLDVTGDVAVHEQVLNPPMSPLDVPTFTIEAWIFPLADTSMLVVADSAHYLMVRPQPLRMELAVMTSTGFPVVSSYSGNANPLELGHWNHVVGMVDGSSRTLQLAVNGESSSVLPFASDVDASYPQTFSVGNSYPAALGDFPFIGRIDDVRLSSFIRYSGDFTPASVLDPDERTLGLWHFDEPEGGTTFADSSGNGNTLTAFGGAATVAGTRAVTPVASGSLLPGFGTDGVVTVNPSLYDEAPADVLVAGGALYVVGGDQSVGPQWRIEKRNLSTGALVPSFGTGGVLTSNPSSGYDEATAAVSDGTNLYIVGYDMVPSFGDYEWRIEKRLLSTGGLVTAFGTNGVVMVNPSASTDIPWAVVDDGTSLYVVGYDYGTGDAQWRVEKRSMSTGALVATFGTGGVVVSESGGRPTSAVVQGTSLFVVGSVNMAHGYEWRIEKRSLETGALATEFGAGGVVGAAPPADGQPNAVSTDGTNLYVAGYGGDHASMDWQWNVEKLDASTGALVTAFGAQGVVSSSPGFADDGARALVLDGGSLYVAGYDHAGADAEWRIEKRSLDSGALATQFGTGGVVTWNPSSNSGGYTETATAIASDGASLYVVSIDYSTRNARWRIEKRTE